MVNVHDFPYAAMFQGIGLIVICSLWIGYMIWDGRR